MRADSVWGEGVRTLILLAMALAATGGQGRAESASTALSAPAQMQGVWARRGRCDRAADRFTITAHTAGWGRGPLDRIIYDPDESAIEWAQEGEVDNFVLGGVPNLLVHNIEGFGMPEREGLARCDRGAARVRWPVEGLPR